MLLPCLSNIYKNLARGTALLLSVLSLHHRSAFTACFLSQQTQKFLFRGCKCSPLRCSPHCQFLQSHNVIFHGFPLSALATLGHPIQHPRCQHLQTQCTMLCYKLHMLHYSVTWNLSPKLEILTGEYILIRCSLSKQKACGKTSCLLSDHNTSCLLSDHNTCSVQLWVDMLSYMLEIL